MRNQGGQPQNNGRQVPPPQAQPRVQAPADEDMPPPIEGADIVTISGGPHPAGTSRNAQKRYVNELKTSDGSPHVPEARAPKQQRVESLPITFTEEDASHVQFPHHDPLVITIQVANRRIHRAFVDNGSSVNIMFKPTLEKIGLTDRDLKPYSTLLYGFGGDGTACAGIIELAVTLGEYPLSVTKMIDFVVVDIKSAYNLIIGRPLLASLGQSRQSSI